ncbi:phosphoenolpyruvate--protein phosphotransferase [Aeromonas enteropelogenes]|uniref:phosphoenolpyruvate--protein phosphotransferase n=1 Tax=Aeromonas enteropelogenes TaxID=29489 RepID=UPI0038D229C0
MQYELNFQCVLPNGIHARPASQLEEKCRQFVSQITLMNHRSAKSGDAKSSLDLIGTDTNYQDECSLYIKGDDAGQAFDSLQLYINNEFHLCDEPLAQVEEKQVCIPKSLLNHNTELVYGKPLVAGIVKGRLYKSDSVTLQSYATDIQENETVRFSNAHASVVKNIEARLNSANDQEAEILNSHLSMLTDNNLIASITKLLTYNSTANAIILAVDEYIAKFNCSCSEYIRERIVDLQDLGLQLLSAAYPTAQYEMATLVEDSIVIAEEMTPSQFIKLDKSHLKGLVLGKASHTSHTIILARSFNIPTLVSDALPAVTDIEHPLAYLDCQLGVIAVQPNEGAACYFERAMRLAKQSKNCQQVYVGKSVATIDGHKIEVAANISHPIEVAGAMDSGADGVGLFRTEMAYMDRELAPTEEELYEYYRDALIAGKENSITFRTIDIGGDKPLPYLNLPPENNPFLGYRAVRIYPQFITLFHHQLRALLRASVYGNARIMIPMINSIEEIRWIKAELAKVKEQLKQEGIPFSANIELGIMVEIPSAVFILDHICKEIDFISIGSNDMTQYLLAIDRDNQSISHLYNSLVPSFLRMLEQVISTAHQHRCWVGLCGELASDHRALPFLLGSGLDELSMNNPAILATKSRLAGMSYQQCRELFLKACQCSTKAEINKLFHDMPLNTQEKTIISYECILLDVEFVSKEDAIQAMVGNLGIIGRTDNIFALENDIWAREAVLATDLGFGFAIPHTKSEHIQYSTISMARLTKPIHWQGDSGMVNFIIMLTLNSKDSAQHMKIFSSLARKLIHKEFRDQLHTTQCRDDIIELLSTLFK